MKTATIILNLQDAVCKKVINDMGDEFSIRPATPEDCSQVIDMITELAVYEKECLGEDQKSYAVSWI